MGRFAEKHPRELTAIIGVAIANGATAASVARSLAAGTLNGWPAPYEMPLETVRYYGKQERRRRQAKTVTKEAQENPKREVDRLARLLLSAAQHGLEAARPGIDKDPKALKEWGEALKVINGLVSDTSTDKPPGKTRREPVPTDALSARLLTADRQNTEKTAQPPTTNTENTDQQNHTDMNSGGVAAQVAPSPVFAA